MSGIGFSFRFFVDISSIHSRIPKIFRIAGPGQQLYKPLFLLSIQFVAELANQFNVLACDVQQK
jgi:hypothetical protein